MGVNLPIRREVYDYAENQSWLGSKHGTQEADPITLDGDAFLTAFPTGVIPSGVVLGRVTATGKYQPYNNGLATGVETARGHLFTSVDLGGTTAAVVGDVAAALYWHGEVVEANLPTNHGLDAPAKVDLAQIRYV